MRVLISSAAICAALFNTSAQAREPAMSWSVQRLDASGALVMQEFGKSNFDAANLQARTLCDKAMAARAGWPETSGVRITVRPIDAAPDDPRKKLATVLCAEYASNPSALEGHIARPQAKPQPVAKQINFWD